jgi:hypothetical protein
VCKIYYTNIYTIKYIAIPIILSKIIAIFILNENKAGLILQTTITIVITTDPSNASKVI